MAKPDWPPLYSLRVANNAAVTHSLASGISIPLPFSFSVWGMGLGATTNDLMGIMANGYGQSGESWLALNSYEYGGVKFWITGSTNTGDILTWIPGYGDKRVRANVWYHLCAVAESTTSRKLYINGVLEGTSTVDIGTWTSSTKIGLGGRYNSWTNGNAFAVAPCIYSVALSAGDAARLYAGTDPRQVRGDGLYAYWPQEPGQILKRYHSKGVQADRFDSNGNAYPARCTALPPQLMPRPNRAYLFNAPPAASAGMVIQRRPTIARQTILRM